MEKAILLLKNQRAIRDSLLLDQEGKMLLWKWVENLGMIDESFVFSMEPKTQ